VVNVNFQSERRLRPSQRRRGLSLPEAMISLAITSLLLVSVATAFSASCSAIEANDRFFRSSQAARVALNQLLLDIRNTTSLPAANVTATSIVVKRPPFVAGGGQLIYATTNPQNPAEVESWRTYAYDAANKRITLQITYNDGATSPVYELAGNVTAFSLGTPDTMTGDSGVLIAIRVPVTMTVSAGGANVTLNGSAGPRQYLAY
jgi:type II secretory pathway pseudopilin PulG